MKAEQRKKIVLGRLAHMLVSELIIGSAEILAMHLRGFIGLSCG